jgi:hypothetical protein
VKRRVVLVCALTVALIALSWAPASAEYLGTDLWSNLSPETQLGGLSEKYPISHFQLDTHIDGGFDNLGGYVSMGMQFFTSLFWAGAVMLLKLAILLFSWAFSLDFLTGPDGALSPVGQGIRHLHNVVLGDNWMIIAMVLTGVWVLIKYGRRRVDEITVGLGTAFLLLGVCLFLVWQPEKTIGEASKLSNAMAVGFLSGINRGSLDNPAEARQQVADHLTEVLVYKPWMVLNFGGLSHCVDTDKKNEDGYPTPVGPHNKARDVCRDNNKYAQRFIALPPGSEERNKEYDALKEGEAPSEAQFAGYTLDKNDSPAADMMQEGGTIQRFVFAAVIFVATLGPIIVLSVASLVIILAMVIVLLMVMFSPVFLVLAIFPPAHHLVKAWLTKMLVAIFVGTFFALGISAIVAVSAALMAASAVTGFLLSYGLICAFWWSPFILRKKIFGAIFDSKMARSFDNKTSLPVMAGAAGATSYIATKPLHSMVTKNMRKQESALREDKTEETKKADGVVKNEDFKYDYAESSQSGSNQELKRVGYDKSVSSLKADDATVEMNGANNTVKINNGKVETEDMKPFTDDLRAARQEHNYESATPQPVPYGKAPADSPFSKKQAVVDTRPELDPKAALKADLDEMRERKKNVTKVLDS